MIALPNHFTLDFPPTDLQAFAMFSLAMPDCAEDLWHFRPTYRRGEAVDDRNADLTPADVQKSARQKRVEYLRDLYALCSPEEITPFEMDKSNE